jgi:hypothetical protein
MKHFVNFLLKCKIVTLGFLEGPHMVTVLTLLDMFPGNRFFCYIVIIIKSRRRDPLAIDQDNFSPSSKARSQEPMATASHNASIATSNKVEVNPCHCHSTNCSIWMKIVIIVVV